MSPRGMAAFVLASSAVLLMVAGLVGWAIFAWHYPALMVGPTVGLILAVVVWLALHARCTRGVRWADPVAAGIVLIMGPLAILGMSFGGLTALAAVPLLAIAHVLTPRAR